MFAAKYLGPVSCREWSSSREEGGGGGQAWLKDLLYLFM